MSRAFHLSATRLSASLVAVALLLFASAAVAKDLCIDDPNNSANPDYIANKFKIPKPGTCRPFVGLYWPDFWYRGTALQGVACVPTSADVVNFTMTLGFMPTLPTGGPGEVAFVTVALSLPSLQGRYVRRFWGAAHSESEGQAVAYACDSKVFI